MRFFNSHSTPDVSLDGELVGFVNSEQLVNETMVVASTKDEAGQQLRLMADLSKKPHVNHLKLPHFPGQGKCVDSINGTEVVGNIPDEANPVI
jgi:hypothetical protein